MDDLAPIASPNDAVRWLQKAGDDLIVADHVSGGAFGVNWAACFQAQQAAEKALKAVLVATGIDFPRSHALERLVASSQPTPQSCSTRNASRS